MKHGTGVSNIEITDENIKAFAATAKKYGIDFALKRDISDPPPRYLVFFKGRDADVLTAAFKEFSARKLTQEKKPSIHKLLIPNLPYLLFVYLFDKMAQAVRLAPGMDASEKLLQIGDGFTAAFSSFAPSLQPLDMLIGIVGAVALRLIVYFKGKNAKKYRKGIEYGSARWGAYY